MTAPHPITPGVRYKDVVDFPGYCVGDDGSVWSYRGRHRGGANGPWKRRATTKDKHGYLRVGLWRNNEGYTRLVHHLVLEAFVGPRPRGEVCRHFPDRNPSNCSLANLQWGTQQENMDDAAVHGTRPKGSGHVRAKLSDADVLAMRAAVDRGEKVGEVASRFGITSSTFSAILSGHTWAHLGVADSEDRRAGPKRWARKLTEADVNEMFRLRASGVKQSVLMERFGISSAHVSRILSGQRWQYLQKG